MVVQPLAVKRGHGNRALAGDVETYLTGQGRSRALMEIVQDAWSVAARAIVGLQKRRTD